MGTDNAIWGVYMTTPRMERRAVERLEAKGFSVYCPFSCHERLIRGQKVRIEAALFPGYLFIAMNSRLLPPSDLAWPVKFNGFIAHLVDEKIKQIQEREDALGFIVIEQPARPMFRRGQVVRLASGPFQGIDAIFSCQTAQNRVAVLMDFLGGKTRVEIEAADIQAA